MVHRTNKPLKWYRDTYIKDKYQCVYCDKDLTERFDDWMSIQVDHLIPLSKGGSDKLDNRVTSCNICNSIKHSYLPDDYGNLSKEKLLNKIKIYILDKRETWKRRYKKALIEYKNNI